MTTFQITEAFLAEIAGWDVLKQARSLLASGKVHGSDWRPPILKGSVQEGTATYRAGFVIKDKINIENMCGCRASRSWGTVCVHSVAVGLHWVRSRQSLPLEKSAPTSLSSAPSAAPKTSAAPAKTAAKASRALRRLKRAEPGHGDEAELFVIFPPNLVQAIAKGKIMLYFEGKWSGGRAPLNALPLTAELLFSAQDAALLDAIESLAGGDTPGMCNYSGLFAVTPVGDVGPNRHKKSSI